MFEIAVRKLQNIINDLKSTRIYLEDAEEYQSQVNELQSAIGVLQKAGSIKRDCKYYPECSRLNTILPSCDIAECSEYEKVGEGK